MAELARAKYLNGDVCDLAELVSATRAADAAMKRLGLPERPAQSGQAPAPVSDLSLLSGPQLDAYATLLAEAKEGGSL